MTDNILEIQDLHTHFHTAEGGILRASDGLTFSVKRGECCAIIGESGSGKSVSAMSILRLIPNPPGEIVGGKILFMGQDLLTLSDREMQKLRGSRIGMIFQEPSTALNPVMTIGNQIAESLRTHQSLGKKEAMAQAVELLRKVKIPNPEQRVRQYPHEFSGGMQQRAMIAMAMSCQPDLLIADEPTTALDVTVQAQVLEQLDELRRENNTTLIIITHNLGVVARYADSVKIVYGGSVVESGSPYDVFEHPQHPYTLGLIRAVPRLDRPRSYGLHSIQGEPPDMSKIPAGCCAFQNRCRYATETCRQARPPMEHLEGEHYCACFHRDKTKGEREELLV